MCRIWHKAKPTSVKNPQANGICERVHQVIANMIRTFNVPELDINLQDPWSEIINAVAWAIRSSYNTGIDATPGELVFGRDMIYNIPYVPNWSLIEKRKQDMIDKNLKRENKTRYDFDYKIGDKVLIRLTEIQRKLNKKAEGPYEILQNFTNGTVKIQRGACQERINIRRLQPYTEQQSIYN